MKVDTELYKLLRRAKFFSEYSDKELKKLYKYFTWTSHVEGEIIYNENEMGGEMSIILYGEAKVFTIENDKQVDLAIIKEGDILGETSVFIKQPWFATVKAHTNCELAALSNNGLNLLIAKEKNLALKFIMQIATTLANRFRDAKLEVKRYLLKK